MDSEKQLIERARHHPEAFGQLYDTYYPKIFGYVFRVTGNYALAADIVSETFLKAWLRIGSFKWKGISISSWFFKIATNELNQYFRKKKYIPSTLSDLSLVRETNDTLAQMDRLEEFEYIQKMLQLLPPRYQQVIALRYFEELSIRDLSEILGKKEGTIKSLLSRGLDKLKIMMETAATNGYL